MQEFRLWLLNHIGNAFTINTHQTKYVQLHNTLDEAVTVKRVSATSSCAWAISHNHRVYIYVFSSDVPIRIPDTTYENQRWSPLHGFSRKSLIPTDRNDWSDEHGIGYRPKESVRLPSPHWQWEGHWFIDDNLRGDVVGIEGWQYAVDFPSVYTPEKHWNSFVRKRKWIRFRRFVATNTWARVSDMEVADNAECFIDISVGGLLLPTKQRGMLAVWGVTNNGNIYVRTNTRQDNPEGDSWNQISLDGQNGVVNISVGVSNLVWAITWDGHALVRTNVTRNNIYGTDWELVDYPNEDTRLMQVAVGHNSVWALSREGTIWFRKGTWGDDMYGNTQSAVGTMWVKMVGEMVHIAVSANDQVFAIEKNTREILFRTGITPTDLTGKTWQTVSLEEDLSLLEREGRLSVGAVCSCCDEDDSTCEYHQSFQSDLVMTRSSSSVTSPISMEENNANAFMTPTDSFPHPFPFSDDASNITVTTGIDDDTIKRVPSNSVGVGSRIPLFSVSDSPPLDQISVQSPSKSAINGASEFEINSHSIPSIAAETKTLQNYEKKNTSMVESTQIVEDETNNTSLSQTAILPSSPITRVLENTLLTASSPSIDKSINEEGNQKPAKNKKLKEHVHSKIEKKHRVKACLVDDQENSTSDIVFHGKKGKKKHKLKHNKTLENEMVNSIRSPPADEEESEPLSLISIESSDIGNAAVEVNATSLGKLNACQVPNNFEFIDAEDSSSSPSKLPSHIITHSNSTDNPNEDVQDTLDSVCPPRSPSMNGENQTADTVTNECMVVETVKSNSLTKENINSSQLDVHNPSSIKSSRADIKKTSRIEYSYYNRASLDSSDSSSASDGIIDFVTDLMSDEEETQEVFFPKEVEEDSSTSTGCGKTDICPPDITDNYGVTTAPIQETVAKVTELPLQSHPSVSMTQTFDRSVEQSSYAITQIHRSPSVGVDSNCSESNSAVVPFYTLNEAQPRQAWRWLDVTSCLIENPSTVPWLENKSQGSTSKSKITVTISLALRNDVLEKLRVRNKREIQPFLDIPSAIEKETWVKRTQMHLYLYGNHSRWMACSVELEQGISNVKEGCLTLQYCHKNTQKHVQVKNDEIVCVKMSSNTDEKSTFFIYPANSKVIYQPLMLRAASEEEALEWVGYLCLANTNAWTAYQPVLPGVAWSCTFAGDVFVSVDTSNCDKSCDLYWIQHGGHMSLIESGTNGVTWALGFDQMPYVYNGGYGGASNIGTTGMNDNLQEITDHDRVCVYENQKWFPVVGWCNKGVLYNDFHWLTLSGKSVESRDDIKLPSSKWHWISDWTVDFNSPGGVNSKGWQFSTNLYGHFHSHQNMKDYYRRRRWSRTCRLITQGPWQTVGALKLLDISVQIDPVTSNTDHILVWAVGANGNVLCRNGVTMSNPEGDSWNHVATFLDKPYRSISVGGGYRVWGIASDGSAWFRAGVSQTNHSGTTWLQVVPPPPGNSLLKQVSAGASAVWAVDTKDRLWRRENITSTFPEGTGWEFVISKVKYVSVGPNDQVWIVAGAGFSRYKHEAGVVYKRVGISEKKPSGMDWTAVIGCGWSRVSVRGMT